MAAQRKPARGRMITRDTGGSSVERHLENIAASGRSAADYFAALREVRADPDMTKAQRDVIHKKLAQQALVGLKACLNGRPIDLGRLIREARGINRRM